MAIMVDVVLVSEDGDRAVYEVSASGGPPQQITLIWQGEDDPALADPPEQTWNHAIRHAVSKILGRRLESGEWPRQFGSAS